MTARYETDDGEISAITLFIRLLPFWLRPFGVDWRDNRRPRANGRPASCHQMFISPTNDTSPRLGPRWDSREGIIAPYTRVRCVTDVTIGASYHG